MSEIFARCEKTTGNTHDREPYYLLYLNGIFVGDIYDESKIEHIVICINESNNLSNEVERLRKGLDYADKANRVLKDQNADLFYAKEKVEAEVERLKKAFNWIKIQFESNYETSELDTFGETIYRYVKAWTERDGVKDEQD